MTQGERILLYSVTRLGLSSDRRTPVPARNSSRPAHAHTHRGRERSERFLVAISTCKELSLPSALLFCVLMVSLAARLHRREKGKGSKRLQGAVNNKWFTISRVQYVEGQTICSAVCGCTKGAF